MDEQRRPSHVRSVILTIDHVAEALLSSPDNGRTIDLSHLALSDLDEAAIEQLAAAGFGGDGRDGPVTRIALGFNHLRTLSTNFALFTRLRYLNLKSNALVDFPIVLTRLPTLEILDLGRNKISSLPDDPGSLRSLRVFSLTRNRVQQLPAYLKDFEHLRVLKVDHNPITWPSDDIMGRVPSLDTNEALELWVVDLKEWLADNSSNGPIQPTELTGENHLMLETNGGFQRRPQADIELTSDEDRIPLDGYDIGESQWSFQNAHLRNQSEESFTSFHSDSPAVNQKIPLSGSPRVADPRFESHGMLSPLEREAMAILPEHQHGRNASYSPGFGIHRPARSMLAGKKSLPELRSGQHYERKPSLKVQGVSPFNDSMRQDWSASGHGDRYPDLERSLQQESIDEQAPPVEVERNSYFQRLSIMPLPNPSGQDAVSLSLFKVTDAIRGILFALSQIYSAVRNYTLYGVDDRLSSILGRVLDPASKYMSLLINSLDSFDAASQKGVPPAATSRQLIECCKDNIAVFGKVVGMLQLQSKLLALSHDVRYTRTLVLMMYGSMAEISSSWSAMMPHVESVQSLLQETRPPEQPRLPSGPRIPISPIQELNEVPPLRLTKLASPGAAIPASLTAQSPRSRVRRHAGSFSHREVQIGGAISSMPSPLTPSKSPPSRSRQPGMDAQTITPTIPFPSVGPLIHSREPSLSSSNPLGIPLQRSRPSQAGNLPVTAPGITPSIVRVQVLDRSVDSSKVVDQDLMFAIDAATESALSVWPLVSEVVDDVPNVKGDLKETIERATSLTMRLRDNNTAIRAEGESLDKRLVADDAHAFVKVVVQVSILLKGFSAAHPLSAALRTSVAQLTKRTQEVTIFLHVSSFSPSPTPRPFSPAGPSAEDGRPLGRSRSATASSQTAKMADNSRETPWSAMPHQNFKVPPLPK